MTAPARFATCGISTHAPRTGSDVMADFHSFDSRTFQPTLPARGATTSSSTVTPETFISTHAPRTGSDTTSPGSSPMSFAISTHAPRTGSDGHLRGRAIVVRDISTHAPRTGSDLNAFT